MQISVQRRSRWLPISALLLLAACATSRPPTPVIKSAGALPPLTVDDLVARHLDPGDQLLIGAGDIADCDALGHAKATAAIIQKFPSATVFTAGDDAYVNGTRAEFEKCYGAGWGGFKERTWPSPGNHDYGIYPPVRRFDAQPYYDYFGTNARPAGLGYYSHGLGGWHVVSLDSMADQRGAPKMADQVAWLKEDLAASKSRCTLAFWHHPLFSSGEHGDQADDPGRAVTPLWNELLGHKADVIVNGHDHHYERFARQDAAHNPTPLGIREFIAGTGGGEDRRIEKVKANSEVQLAHVYGVLLLTLHSSSYEWHFIDVDGKVRDSGRDECH